MNVSVLAFFFVVLIFSGCSSCPDKFIPEDIEKIEIIPKVSRRKDLNLYLTRKKDFVTFCKAYEDLEPISGDVKVRSNKGFYVIKVHSKSEKCCELHMIITAYHGNVIRLNHEYFDGDLLSNWILNMY